MDNANILESLALSPLELSTL